MEKETTTKKRSSILLVIILATVFGLGSGIASNFITKPYLLKDVYNIPFSGEINFSGDRLRKANLIIENAKNITIEQDKKVNETINRASESLVGIFIKKENTIKESSDDKKLIETEEFNIENIYKLDEKIAEGIIVTSDGWLLTTPFDTTKDSFVAITKDGKMYELDIESTEKLTNSSYFFIRLKNVKDLPVKNFAPKKSLSSGQLIIATNWEKISYLSYVLNRDSEKKIILSSDKLDDKFTLTGDLNKYFKNVFIFNLNGEIIGLFNEKEGLVAMNLFQSRLKGLLEESIHQPSLGINYINLDSIILSDGKTKKGALIYSDEKVQGIEEKSAAEIAGLKTGDIIISINNIEIDTNNNIAEIIQEYLPGEEIDIIFLRNGKEMTTKAKLKKIETNLL